MAVNRWRLERNLPERLFWIEKIDHPRIKGVRKPQYLDFTSPLCVEIFRSVMCLNSDPLTFEEALPAPEDMIPGPGQERWALELQIDTLSLGPDDFPRYS